MKGKGLLPIVVPSQIIEGSVFWAFSERLVFSSGPYFAIPSSPLSVGRLGEPETRRGSPGG